MKKTMTKILLVMLPIMAVALATTRDSVQVINTVTAQAVAGSYFDLLPTDTMPMAGPGAGICAILSGILAVIYLFSKKRGVLQGSKWCAFVGACFAVLPLFVRGEVMVIPNVGVPLLLMAQFVVCAISGKLPKEEKTEYQGPRLERH